MNRSSRCVLTALAVLSTCLLAPFSAAGVTSDAALGDDGRLYVVQAGLYGELFPEGTETAPEHPVLAVSVARDDEPAKLLLVPKTAGPEAERSPIVTFEPESRTVYVLWESQTKPTVSALFLAGLQPDGWTDAIEISGDIEPLKGAPRVLATVDDYTLPTEDRGLARHARTVLHVVWWEEAAGSTEVFYAPVVLEDGLYVGWNPVLRLNELATGSPLDPEGELPASLVHATQLMPGRDINSSVITFTDASSGRLITLESRLLPSELGRIADELRAQIIHIGRGGGPLGSIQDKLRAQIIHIGRDLNPGMVGYFADKAIEAFEALDEEYPDLPDNALADKLRAQIIHIGSRLLVGYGWGAGGADGGAPGAELIAESSAGEAGGGHLTHLVLVQRVRSFPTPPVNEGPLDIFVSEDGLQVLLFGEREGSHMYTEFPDGGELRWSMPKRLNVRDDFDAERIEQVLLGRVSRRR